MEAGKLGRTAPGVGARPRAHEVPGLFLGRLPRGPQNAITDVPGVRVGHSTIIEGEGPLLPGRGPVRTGVTAILPHGGNVFAEKVPAAVHVINGFGKATGLVQVMECGVLETPILLTNTLNVGRVADALIDHTLAANREIGITTSTVNPVVAECNDGYLNDIQGRHVGAKHVAEALRAALAGGPVAEGAVGAGTGMSAFGWKGGIGTASRLVRRPGVLAGRDGARWEDAAEDGGVRLQDDAGGGGAAAIRPRDYYVLGALVLSNFGAPEDLTVGGWPVGRFLRPPSPQPDGAGSVVVVLATDAPLDARQLRRVAERAVVGIVRCGGRLHHGSGDFVIAFSTAYRIAHTFAAPQERPAAGVPVLPFDPVQLVPDDHPLMADLLAAAGEATEEAVLNSMFQAYTVVGRDGHVREALPVDEVARLIARWTA